MKSDNLDENIEIVEESDDSQLDIREYSQSDVRLRRHEATKLYFKRWRVVDIINHLIETYGVSKRTAAKDVKWIKDDINRKCERRERAWLNRKTDTILQNIEDYEKRANIASDEKAMAALLKQRDALEKELDQWTLPGHLAKLRGNIQSESSLDQFKAITLECAQAFNSQRSEYESGGEDGEEQED